MAAPPCTAGTRLGAAPAPSSRLTQALFKLVLNVVAAVLQVINNVTKAGVSQLLSDLGIHTQHAQAAAEGQTGGGEAGTCVSSGTAIDACAAPARRLCCHGRLAS